MRTKYDRPQLAIPRQPLQTIPIVIVQRLPELSEQMPQKRRVRHHRDALLRALIQPLQKLHGARAAVLVGLAPVRVEHVVVVDDLRKVEIGKLRGDLADGTSAVADVPTPPLATLLPHEESRGGDLRSRRPLGGAFRSVGRREEGGLARFARRSEDSQCRLAGSGEGRYDDEIEGGEGSRSGGTFGEVSAEHFGLIDALGGESRIVEGVCGGGRRSSEEAGVVSRFLRGDVVIALGVTDEVDLLRTVR
mmetsp:Transcript_31729/g.58126  ORF Transcript_31729/g.58126 Transcript_31729/m.58126 type:complete len:248 (+) Transcript_31729:565-1308(+)